ncbi:hypothetical protein B7463_g11297, partial [Scytalidium lignicola]
MSTSAPIFVDEIVTEAGGSGANLDILDSYFLLENTSETDITSVAIDNFFQSPPKSLSEASQPPSPDHWLDQTDNIGFPISTCGLIAEPSFNMTNYDIAKAPVCNCFNICLQALQTLYNNSDTALFPLPFDIILTVNQKAVEACAIMLNCQACVSKSNPGITTMLLGTIIGKIISIYQDASKNYLRMTARPGGQAQSPSLTFGSYRVEGEDGRWLEAEIILREIKKLRILFDDFQEKSRTNAGQEDPGMHNAVTNYLYHSLQYTTDIWEQHKDIA